MSDRDDAPTVMALGAIAFVAACVAHEVLGHGAPYLLLGGEGVVFTPARPEFASALTVRQGLVVDLGGPLTAIALGAFAFWFPAKGENWRIFLVGLAAFCLFWNFGYAPWSLATGAGDWAQVARATEGSFFAAAAVTAGVAGYAATCWLIQRRLRGRAVTARWLWLGGSVAATLGALLDPRGALAGLMAAVPASALASLPLLFVRTSEADAGRVSPDRRWQAVAVGVVAVYVLGFGPGIGVGS